MMNPIGRGGALPAGTEQPSGDVYVLQPGDTFDSLVERFGIGDPKAVDEFRRLNPDLALGRALPGAVISLPAHVGPAAPLATSWTRGYGRDISRQNRYNAELEAARARWSELDPLVLKSLLAQESGFRSRVVNRYGYTGVAQLGVAEARQVGLRTGHSRMANARKGVAAYVDRARDERLHPAKAIPGAARLLRAKAATLARGIESKRWGHLPGYARYGEPSGDDFWRFATAAYNGGEGTVLLAMRIAYGDSQPAEVRWDDLVRSPDGDVRHAPLYLAIKRVGMKPAVKFREISEYARDVVLRARQ